MDILDFVTRYGFGAALIMVAIFLVLWSLMNVTKWHERSMTENRKAKADNGDLDIEKLAIAAVRSWIAEYQVRVNNNVRFICNRQSLEVCFPEYTPTVLDAVWEKCVSQGWVRKDPLDGEWIVAP